MLPDNEAAGRELVLHRMLDAPRTLVFAAWTDPNHLTRWWGPHGFTTVVHEADARPGGSLLLEMRGPADSDYPGPFPMWGTFIDVFEPERIVFTAQLRTEAGAVFLELLDTVTLVEHDGKTALTLSVRVVRAGPKATEPLSGMTEGWIQSLERLQAFVARMIEPIDI